MEEFSGLQGFHDEWYYLLDGGNKKAAPGEPLFYKTFFKDRIWSYNDDRAVFAYCPGSPRDPG